MTYQGYLIQHLHRQPSRVLFFSIEDGYLRAYTSSDSDQVVEEMKLTGCRINVKAQRRGDGIPNSFYVETRYVIVKDRTYTLDKPVRLELSAVSNTQRQEWGKALHSWHRYYWRDPSQRLSDTSESGSTSSISSTSVSTSELLVLEDAITKAKLLDALQRYQRTAQSSNMSSISLSKQPLAFLKRTLSMSISTRHSDEDNQEEKEEAASENNKKEVQSARSFLSFGKPSCTSKSANLNNQKEYVL